MNQRLYIVIGDIVPIDNLVFAGKAIAAVEGDVTVKLQIAKVIDGNAVATRRDKHLHTFLAQNFECLNSGAGHFVRLETHQCPVDIEENSLNHITILITAPILRRAKIDKNAKPERQGFYK